MRRRILIGIGVVACFSGLSAWCRADPPPSASPGLPRLVSLPAGLEVGKQPPEGWGRLVIKSVPRLASGDLSSLPASAKTTATLFRTVILANSRMKPGGGFVLDKIGLGLCLPREGSDVVVTPRSNLAALGISLGTLDQIVLDQAARQLARAHLVARSPTFALMDAPTTLSRSGTHREGLVRYAILVEPRSGSITVALWPLATAPSSRMAADSLVLLAPSLVCESPVDVSAIKLLGEIPVSWSFALAALPPGRTVRLPADLGRRAALDPQVPADVIALERELRLVLSQAK